MPSLVEQGSESGSAYHLLVKITEGPFAGRDLNAELDICSSPICACTDVRFALKDEAGRVLASFSVDASAKSRSEHDSRSDNQENTLSDRVIRGFDDEDWKTLWRQFIKAKSRFTDDLDPSKVEADFPMAADIEEHSELVPFNAVFPHATTHFLEYPDEFIVADEQYCLVRGCDCDRIALAFLVIRNGAQAPGEHHMVWVNYRTGKMFGGDAGDSTTRKPEELFAALMAKHPSLMATYAKRHRQLTSLYEAYWRRHSARPSPSRPKAGRNEPCPCGSGKKVKRCCGSN